ncbi:MULTISPECIES: efflux RND transporter periplasmic adaptor subunit [unclassified Spirosoma]|uniref:efflux RND transporter periplasmic adaptor subunit n=1 Tax=unclassified Spirosoma TaxID=2621999 RepID=UPI000963D3D5|nr:MULTISPECIES: efflux RND transporter periplasmic adaptor subunit [unclassified Spirosoma]MBN8823387.1 efflux RND transporter periplasmic adaptor subunit [Spirosoma sp.]OJW71994.1 MAG: efflux transporter periplasmic adaptor subunit [Spirosoma sp. 48-14]
MVACTTASSDHKTPAKEPEIQQVVVSTVQSLQPSKRVTLPGELKPWNRVSMYAKVKGFVRDVSVDRGTVVRKGQVLARLDAPEVISELSQAQAQLQAQEATLVEQTTRARASKLTYTRLLQTAKMEGAVSANELDQAQARMQADSAMVAVARGTVQASRSNYQAKTELRQYLTITAPFDGIVIERNISPGALVGAGDSGKPLFVLEDSRTLRLTVAIPELFANQLPPNSSVSFTVNAMPDRRFNAKLARSAQSLVEANRSMMAEFDVPNAAHELKAGMYAEVQMPIERTAKTLFVPTTAVVNSSEKMFLIKVQDNRAQWVSVQKGNVLDSLVEVFGDVQPGMAIVKKASEEIRDGQEVKAVQK